MWIHASAVLSPHQLGIVHCVIVGVLNIHCNVQGCVVGVAFGSSRAGAGKSELIVVASLIDKAPNLGGLARTCEIFDAQCLVVSDREILTHREFTLLSMSAEKWVDIKEVPSEDLAQWLAVRLPCYILSDCFRLLCYSLGLNLALVESITLCHTSNCSVLRAAVVSCPASLTSSSFSHPASLTVSFSRSPVRSEYCGATPSSQGCIVV